jgi:hypothetical protein
MELSTPEIFIRFVGNGQEHKASDEARIDEWVARIKNMAGIRAWKRFISSCTSMMRKDTPILANYTIRQPSIKHLGSKSR